MKYTVSVAAIVGLAAAAVPAQYGASSMSLSSSSASAAASYACNPAHSYPNGASCISTAGTLSLVTPSASASKSTPPAAYTTQVVTAYTTYCPEATSWTEHGSTYSVTSATTVTVTHCPGGCTISVPVSTPTPSAVTPTPSAAKSTPPAVWVTTVVTAYTTYCPQATSWTEHGSTYSVTSATSVTVTHCPGGCTISSPVAPPPMSTPVAPAQPPAKSSPAVSGSGKPPVAPTTTGWAASTGAVTTGPATTSPSVVPYTGAGAKVAASGTFAAALLAVAAFL